ncbi:N-acetylmuramoyl-L-alanine amidase [Calothrix sp. FACHB-1219]|uniref:peptidoglycan recognition protein family protein n=1 Tax=unclassified Calothrix TaxID=2619626 RepID=UPI001688E7AF|nr:MULTISPECIES: peptidoglycan recognition family protein [unclassified Calothrix]MBD2201020.1 N-acetylmuramoyl-L-alanine amidase [Calothrix sp. FACHB-168]MBD2215453.1 N-acetylmuramoyl-L-alanine amidase [Calothrix sp. FACHB-1219]
MRFREWATKVMLICLLFATLILALFAGKSPKPQSDTASAMSDITSWSEYPKAQLQSAKTQESKSQKELLKSRVKKSPPLARYKTTAAFAKYKPRYEVRPVNPTNYGERYAKDIYGAVLRNQPIIVLHETGNSASSAINFFQTPHDNENIQASYHTLIRRDGTVAYLIPPEKRAFGAGNSVFQGPDGLETVKTNPNLPPSVNNFAYHVSLETPPEAWGNNRIQSHSGYTDAQYYSLAWLIAQSQVPDDRITTHQAVDRSGQRVDPLSFDFNKFFYLLHSYRQSIS